MVDSNTSYWSYLQSGYTAATGAAVAAKSAVVEKINGEPKPTGKMLIAVMWAVPGNKLEEGKAAPIHVATNPDVCKPGTPIQLKIFAAPAGTAAGADMSAVPGTLVGGTNAVVDATTFGKANWPVLLLKDGKPPAENMYFVRAVANGEVVVSKTIEYAAPKAPKPKVGYVAFTFDDGPHPDYTPKVLDVLKKHGVKGPRRHGMHRLRAMRRSRLVGFNGAVPSQARNALGAGSLYATTDTLQRSRALAGTEWPVPGIGFPSSRSLQRSRALAGTECPDNGARMYLAQSASTEPCPRRHGMARPSQPACPKPSRLQRSRALAGTE